MKDIFVYNNTLRVWESVMNSWASEVQPMTSLLDQALKAKDAGTFEQWFLSLTPEQREALIAELEITEYQTRLAQSVELHRAPRAIRGPSETK